MRRILVTGAAGFIGAALCERLLDRGDAVLGLDNLSPYYDVGLKTARLERLQGKANFRFERLDIADGAGLQRMMSEGAPESVVHLAAEPGARHSVLNPGVYAQSNLVGFVNVLEGCRRPGVKHLVYASSSSVYGGGARVPFSTHDGADHPLSLYAATKRANELMAHAYAHLFELPCTGLRFFTVYGPWGRPDMAPLLFTKAILEGKPIDVFNGGNLRRDFTYVDDIVEAVTRVLDRPAAANPSWSPQRPDPASSAAPFRIYNVGNGQPVELLAFIETLEKLLGKEAVKRLCPMQPGDVPETFADTSDLERDFGFKPTTPLEQGLSKMVEWRRAYYQG
jgi:UDP-glucuronate 4-epimerase